MECSGVQTTRALRIGDLPETGRGPPAPPARPRPRPRALRPLHQGSPILLWPLVRRLSVRDADRRGPARRRPRGGRDGIPVLNHALLAESLPALAAPPLPPP